jgi:hypothetical protein
LARNLLELVQQVLQELLIEVLTTKHGVTVGGLHLEDTTVDLQDRDIESSTAYKPEKKTS